jgi:hypothetical protein
MRHSAEFEQAQIDLLVKQCSQQRMTWEEYKEKHKSQLEDRMGNLPDTLLNNPIPRNPANPAKPANPANQPTCAQQHDANQLDCLLLRYQESLPLPPPLPPFHSTSKSPISPCSSLPHFFRLAKHGLPAPC